jgi:hypothetical protein
MLSSRGCGGAPGLGLAIALGGTLFKAVPALVG